MSAAPLPPADTLRIAVAQIASRVGDIAGNAAKIRQARDEAGRQGADLVVFPELSLSGSPLRDLARNPAFQAACRREAEALAAESATGPALLIGTPWREGTALHNAVVLLDGGAVSAIRFKVDLVPDGPFGETHLFTAGPHPGPMVLKGVRLGVPVGTDIAGGDVAECLAETGAELLIVPAASPYHRAVYDVRANHAVARVVETDLPLLFVNAVGGQDGAVCDGASFALNADRFLAMQLPNFQDRVRLTQWERFSNGWRCMEAPRADRLDGIQADYAACVRALKDHAAQSGAALALVDLSAGLASAVAGALAVDALGPSQVRGLILRPSAPHHQLRDAGEIAGTLAIQCDTLETAPLAQALADALTPLHSEAAPLLADAGERVRAVVLAAAADVRNALLVCTAPRAGSDLAACGTQARRVFAPLSDLDPADVAAFARLRNGWKPVGSLGPEGVAIPEHLVDLPHDPAAALRARLADPGVSVALLVAEGFDPALVERLAEAVRAPHARCPAPPGVALTQQALGRIHEMPLLHAFREIG
ncbi:MAG: hypothetical protein B7Z15_05075 [Rhizobiales bacterium 32-66-8]|nr:MAG: hypothetical protein B7Z15_05075 [Rhizobiales bacterium 32-66-8]